MKQPLRLDRRASSPKLENDITEVDFPIVSFAAYKALIQGTGADVNLKIKRLVSARNLIGQAILFVDMSLTDFGSAKEQKKTAKRLRFIRQKLESAFTRFPLMIQ